MLVANWKMNGSETMINNWIEGIKSVPKNIQSKCIFCPPSCFLYQASNLIKEKNLEICLGAQDVDPFTENSLTGGISAKMLKNMGCQYVIIGHSERRNYYGEKDPLLLKKILAANSENLEIIFCIGESLEEKKKAKTFEVLKRQISIITNEEKAKFFIAYEPVWAIGTGEVAEIQYIKVVHEMIKEELSNVDLKGFNGIIYGGSIKSDSAKNILAMENVDGLLIGGASLKEKEFSNIVVNTLLN